jgi:hypothetical protein
MAIHATGGQVFLSGASRLAATIVEVVDGAAEEPIYHVAYAEGGAGWWPQSSLFRTADDRCAAEAPALAAEKARRLAALAERRRRAETS